MCINFLYFLVPSKPSYDLKKILVGLSFGDCLFNVAKFLFSKTLLRPDLESRMDEKAI